MTKQVLSIEQMLHLQKLGITSQETLLYWARDCHTVRRAANHYGKWILVKGKGRATVGMTHWEYVPAFTLQDILDILPSFINEYILLIDMMGNIRYDNLSRRNNTVLHATYFNDEENTLIDAAYEMLCWCIENYPEIIKSIKR